MKEKREVWTVMVGHSKWSAEYYKVYGTQEEVETAALALWGYVDQYLNKACACIIKRGNCVSEDDFLDGICLRDCM